MSNDDKLIRALRDMPVPDPHPHFVDRAFEKATGRARPTSPSRLRRFAMAWELWVGAGLGGALAASLTFLVLRPGPLIPSEDHAISLALHETREIEVLIDSERALDDATIRIAVTGGIVLDGFENEREIDWQTDLEPGANVLSLPIVARGTGNGRLVAIVEHDGKRRTIAIDLAVTPSRSSQS